MKLSYYQKNKIKEILKRKGYKNIIKFELNENKITFKIDDKFYKCNEIKEVTLTEDELKEIEIEGLKENLNKALEKFKITPDNNLKKYYYANQIHFFINRLEKLGVVLIFL